MTKVRIPDSFPAAMAQVNAALGLAEAARIATEVTQRRDPYSERTMYEWANPDSGTVLAISLDLALAFDRAYRLNGGEDAPFRDAFAQQLDIAVDAADACRRRLVADSAAFIRETGEAAQALLFATQPGASPHEQHRALVEVQQVERAARPLRRRIASFLRPAIRAGAGKSGGDEK